MVHRTALALGLGLGCLAWPAFAQAPAPTESTGVAAVVNGSVISNYDVDQRVALFAVTSGVRPTAESLPQIRAQVMRSLEDEALEMQEAQKRRIVSTKAELDNELKDIASENKISPQQLVATLAQAGVTNTTFFQQVNAQLTWQKLVLARYGTDIAVTDQQLDEAMNRLRQGADQPQFQFSEIYIAVNRPEDETSVRDSVAQIASQLAMGASFSSVASQFSQSPSAANGGDAGWVLEGQLDEALDQALAAMRPGQISAPIHAEGGYYLLQLRARREPAGAETKTPASDPDAALPLDRLLIPIPANAEKELKDRAMALAINIKNTVKSCSELPGIASQLQGTIYSHLGTMKPDQLDPGLRGALGQSGPGEVVAPFFSPAGLEIVMRCDSANATVALPTRDQLRQELIGQQMSNYAKSYLRELRRDASVYATGN